MKTYLFKNIPGLIALTLSLIIVLGTAVSSFTAVTVDMAQTGAATQVTSLPLQNGDLVGSVTSNYVLEASGSGWKIKNGTSYVRNDYGTIYTNGSSSQALVLSVSVVNNSIQFSFTNQGTARYLTYSNGSFSASWDSSVTIPVYRTSTSYTVTFNANGGSGTMAQQTISGKANLTVNTFTREGYTFTGWNTAADGTGTGYTDGQEITPTDSITLYAQWQQDAPPASANTLYFTNISGWNSLRAYIYNSTTGAEVSAWPGEEMHFEKNNDFDEPIYSITVDPDNYDYIVFNSGSNQTVNINISDALANGAGIYYVDGQLDGDWHCQVNFYTYDDKSSTGDSNTIAYKKQIEKLNPAADDYNYRLHLTMDGSALKDQQIIPGTSTAKGVSGALIIDVTSTMHADWAGSGSDAYKGVQAFAALYDSDGFLSGLLPENSTNQVSVIAMGGFDQGDYDDPNQNVLVEEWTSSITSGRSFHTYQKDGRQPNYIAALLRAADQYSKSGYNSNNDKAIIFIVGNAPQYVSNADGTSPGRAYNHAANAAADTKAFIDTFISNTGISIYVVGMETFGSGTSEVAEYMAAKSVEITGKGGYFDVHNLSEMKDKMNEQILPDIIVSGDTTSNITITDTLSKYVDFASNPNLTATLYTGENFATETNVSSFVSISGDTVTFSRENEIEGPFKLEIAFNIKTADGVLRNTDTYGTVREGYPNEGDADTDYTTATSAGKPGYYANSSATISYNLNGNTVNGTFIKPVVQAPAAPPVQGAYIFKYHDTRYGIDHEVTVPVTLNSSEVAGYDGNNNQQGVPTYKWNTASQALFSANPLLTAAMAVQGNIDEDKNASVYKYDIAWEINDDGATKIAFDANAHTVTVTATLTVKTFTFKYVLPNGDASAPVTGAVNVAYGQIATFHPGYKGTAGCHYINVEIPSDVTYWSADAEGKVLLTTNRTFGMVIRGGYTEYDLDNDIVTAYAQTGTIPNTDGKVWKPYFEEATLTRSVDDAADKNKLYADYMTNYFNVNGTAVQDLLAESGHTIEYGLVVIKAPTETIISDERMTQVVDAMIGKNGGTARESAYVNSEKTAVAYRYHYNDVDHISNFNRTLYTVNGSYSALQGKTLTAMAYIIIDGEYYYSPLNNELVVTAVSD